MKAPPAVLHNIQRGLKLYKQGKGGKGLKTETVAWAMRLCSNKAITYDRAVEMRAWFARFRYNGPAAKARATNPESPAMVSWLLRGGDAGEIWVKEAVHFLTPLELT